MADSGMAGSSARYRQTPDWANCGDKLAPNDAGSTGLEVSIRASSSPPQWEHWVTGRSAVKVAPQSMQRTCNCASASSRLARDESWIRLTAPPDATRVQLMNAWVRERK